MRKPDEIAPMRRVLADPDGYLRDAAGALIPVTKREFGILLKWTGRGWWDYGIHARSGWLTPKGRVALAAIVAALPDQTQETP